MSKRQPTATGLASEAESAMIDALEGQADRDLQQEIDDERAGAERTTLRWSTAQLKVVRRAAATYGMPYQNYIKDAAFRRALADLQMASPRFELPELPTANRMTNDA